MEAERPGGVDTTSDTVPARPASLVSEASTVSDSEEIKTDSEQNDDQETGVFSNAFFVHLFFTVSQ
ncbi:hypothetical protein DPMN_078603 [Dreissena polymorpha]|uniref:Uncharacterized protein n=1 Tax=Dreissena polymorpha TaxID=45954 RepID=A0A9D3YRG0_DREPO|nr:hypothetical protein DPMN_078603 [Dreissena polymorpha]